MYEIEEYDIGVGLGLQKDYETLSTESISNEEILKQLVEKYDTNNIIIRKHPANYKCHYKYEDKFNLDTSETSIEFVSRCHIIISSVSNINLEAMILGKTCYTLGKMPFKSFSYENLNYDDEYIIDIYDLNFLIFGYYVPFEICLNPEYLEFRLSNPTELEIYLKNYDYIIKNYNFNNYKETSGIREKFLKMSIDKNNLLKNRNS